MSDMVIRRSALDGCSFGFWFRERTRMKEEEKKASQLKEVHGVFEEIGTVSQVGLRAGART